MGKLDNDVRCSIESDKDVKGTVACQLQKSKLNKKLDRSSVLELFDEFGTDCLKKAKSSKEKEERVWRFYSKYTVS